jgi:hypothetical protein
MHIGTDTNSIATNIVIIWIYKSCYLDKELKSLLPSLNMYIEWKKDETCKKSSKDINHFSYTAYAENFTKLKPIYKRLSISFTLHFG